MGPLNIIFAGISLITLPEAAKLLRRSPRHLPLFCAAVSAALTLLALVWGAVLLVALPRGLGQLMLGRIWRPTYPLVLPATLYVMSGCATTGALVGLHALGAARRSLRAVIPTSVLVVAFAIVGAVTAGTLGTMRYSRSRILVRRAGDLVAVSAGAARVGHRPRTQMVVARPPGGTPSHVLLDTSLGVVGRASSAGCLVMATPTGSVGRAHRRRSLIPTWMASL